MIDTVATTNQRIKKNDSSLRTEFQLHVNHIRAFDGIRHKTIDFTESKLKRMYDNAIDGATRLAISTILGDYLSGKIVIAWRDGEPLYAKVTRA
jgi:hypothetical protein